MQKVRLIADSGGTKADWAIAFNGDVKSTFSTKGINPFALDDEDIHNVLETELVPKLGHWKPERLDFFGAGCKVSQIERMKRLLKSHIPEAADVRVSSDLLGAAKALFGNRRGIACILGTGANSGIYDGKSIASSMPALGFIIGDEGSGASLGKRLLADVFKKQLSDYVCQYFNEEFGVSVEEIVENTYRKPAANKYLASFVPFLARHIDCPELRELVASEFEAFFRRNILPYGMPNAEISFVGGVAYHFQSLLREAASQGGFVIGSIIDRPFDRLDNLLN